MCYSALVEADIKKLTQRFGAVLKTEDFQNLDELHKINAKKFRTVSERIYPETSYTPVLHLENSKLVISPMRYGLYLSSQAEVIAKSIAEKTKARPTTYNARRDNLNSPYWQNAFMQHHGFIQIKKFNEWVLVSHLLKAGVVSLDEVKDFFADKTEKRKQEILAKGKKYKATATEQKDPRFRQIEIIFSPETEQELLVPIIFSEKALEEGFCDKGFAIVTDEPLLEVAAAGHDRSPVFLLEADMKDWLCPMKKTTMQINKVLEKSSKIKFTHNLAESA